MRELSEASPKGQTEPKPEVVQASEMEDPLDTMFERAMHENEDPPDAASEDSDALMTPPSNKSSPARKSQTPIMQAHKHRQTSPLRIHPSSLHSPGYV